MRAVRTGSVVGLMITASHNPISDNGVKIADPDGGMMTQSWEPFADSLANAPDPESLLDLIMKFAKEECIPIGLKSAEILVGRDTRPSGEALLEAAKQGINTIVGAVAMDMGILTTPQLHWMVRCRNKGLKSSELDYYTQLSKSFRCLMDLVPGERVINNEVENRVVVDGANGIGGEKMEELKKMLNGLEIEVRNSGRKGGVLNDGVGADYVQKEKVVPCGFDADCVGLRCASLDGDADRLVYFRVLSGHENGIDLVDGDKILSLYALFIKEQLNILNEGEEFLVNFGIVQTAYANGASTNYLRQLGLEVVFTPTGVKYLHKKASEYDIGAYFEANGHGTITFSEDLVAQLEAKCQQLATKSTESVRHNAALRLLSVSQLINQAVGDALSGLLLVEAILHHTGLTFKEWSELYHDLPSRQLKVKVPDRSAIVTTNAETHVVRPPGLQEAIDNEITKHHKGRTFIRSSGTEDIVRVYAEASSQDAADSLAHAVAQLAKEFLANYILQY